MKKKPKITAEAAGGRGSRGSRARPKTTTPPRVVPPDADQRVAEIARIIRNSRESHIADLGALVSEAKSLQPGTFHRWVRAELGVDPTAAQYWIRRHQARQTV